MSSELRTKIAAEIRLHAPCIVEVSERAADRILALLPPPATAKLPEGVVVCAMPDGRYHVRGCGWWLLKQGRWEKMTLPTHEYPGEFVSHDEALTAALSAPPVPGESKIDDANTTAIELKVHELVKQRVDADFRIAELEAANETLRCLLDRVANERNDAMFKISQLENPTPTEKPDPLARAVTVGEMLRLADNLKKGDLYFLCNHIRRVFTPPQGASHVE